MTSLLTVIIPTRNRTSLLLQVIDDLLLQANDINNQLEIIVIDDGSTEDIKSLLQDFTSQHLYGHLVHYFFQRAQGPATARNLGINKASGDIVLFIGDDILPSPKFLAGHYLAHTQEYPQENQAILGIADLPQNMCDTPFVFWWRKWNFRYQLLLDGDREPDFSFFYTNNLSLKREFLLKHGLFDESFRYAAYEDGELGARLCKQGMELVFLPQVKAEHYHKIDLHESCKRMITKGKAYDLFIQKTGLPGISRLWEALGSGPWMTPIFIQPLYKFADWLQTRGVISWVYIIVLMYNFQVGRGIKTPLSSMEN